MCRQCKFRPEFNCDFQVTNPENKLTYKNCKFNILNSECSISSRQSCFSSGQCEAAKKFYEEKYIPFYLIGNENYGKCKFALIFECFSGIYCLNIRPSKENIQLKSIYKFVTENNEFVEVNNFCEDDGVSATLFAYHMSGYVFDCIQSYKKSYNINSKSLMNQLNCKSEGVYHYDD